MTADPLLEIAGVSKDYRALRPLRIDRLRLAPGERVAILGLDAAGAEVLVNLVTGAMLPDQGGISLLGRATAAIADSAEWLALVDRVGIVSERAVLLEALTVVQNLAIPFTLQIEPPSDEIRERAIDLAREVALPEAAWGGPVGELDAGGHARVRLARALALDPAVLLLEHASASLAPADVRAFGEIVSAAAARRGASVLAATADEAFASAVATKVLRLDPATGRLSERRSWWRR